MLVTALSEDAARQVCAWRYEPPYDVYDHPSFGEAQSQGWAIADPGARAEQFRAVLDGGCLVGFSRLFQRGGRSLLGVGMAPDLTGRGRGREFMTAVLTDARQRHAGPLELEIRSFNTRALRLYTSLGFAEVGRRTIDVPGGPVEVVVLSDAGPRH